VSWQRALADVARLAAGPAELVVTAVMEMPVGDATWGDIARAERRSR
jgi:hypothetical protein